MEVRKVERFARIGGHPAVDLVNTVDWRLDPERLSDRLSSFGDFLAWCGDMGMVSDVETRRLQEEAQRHPRISADEWLRVLDVREHVYTVLMSAEESAAELLAAEYKEAIDHADLRQRRDDGRWTWTESDLTLRTPRHRLSMSIVDLLRSPEVSRVRQCQDDACGWIFLDTSPRENRRWCVAADCGNRNRVRRHYQRRSREAADNRSEVRA